VVISDGDELRERQGVAGQFNHDVILSNARRDPMSPAAAIS
jgi:hypothetical protein